MHSLMKTVCLSGTTPTINQPGDRYQPFSAVALISSYASARWAAFFLSSTFLYILLSSAQPFNVTVDDLYGPSPTVGEGIQYFGDWTQSGPGFDRADFRDSPGFERTVNQTWHKATRTSNFSSSPRASLKFLGTAVYVQCVLVQGAIDRPANSEMYFKIDDMPTTSFIMPALSSEPGQISTVFGRENLPMGAHELIIHNGPSDGTPMAFETASMFLDAIIYTTSAVAGAEIPSPDLHSSTASFNPVPASPTPTPTSTAREDSAASGITNTDIIVTSVCATTVVVAIIAFLLYRRMRQRFQRQIAVLKSSPLSPPTSPIRPFPANRYSFPISDGHSMTQPSSPRLIFDTPRSTEEAVRPGPISPAPTNILGGERTSPLPNQRTPTRWPTQSSQRSSGSIPPPSYHTRASTAENPFLDVAPEPMPDSRRAA